VLKLEYQRLYERAYLAVDAFDLITAACDLGMDKGQFSAFAGAINGGLRVPWYVVWGYEMALARQLPALHEWVRQLLFKHHNRVLDILETVLASLPLCRSVIDTFRNDVEGIDDTVVEGMTVVIDTYEQLLRISLDAERRAFPSVQEAFVRRTNTLRMITFGQAEAERLRVGGLLTKAQLTNIEDDLQCQMQAVERGRRSPAGHETLPSALSNVQLQSARSCTGRRGAALMGKFRIIQAGDTLCSAGVKSDGVFVILRGLVEVRRQQGLSANVGTREVASIRISSLATPLTSSYRLGAGMELTTGLVVNLVSAMAEVPSASTCIAVTAVEALYYPHHVLLLMAEAMSTELALWETLAVELIASYFGPVFHSFPFSSPESGIRAELGDGTDKWLSFVRTGRLMRSAEFSRVFPEGAKWPRTLLLRGGIDISVTDSQEVTHHTVRAPAVLLNTGDEEHKDEAVSMHVSADFVSLVWEAPGTESTGDRSPLKAVQAEEEGWSESDDRNPSHEALEMGASISSLLITAGSMSDGLCL
jgi:hypothetical protein